jgi:hypothetical protein
MPISSIEPLENRIAPAVILNVVTSAKGITITEDSKNAGASDVLFILQTSGDLTIDPTDSVTQLRVNGGTPLLAGDATTIMGFAGGITGKFGVGDDRLTFTGRIGGAITLDLGVGNNDVAFTDATVGGALTVTGGVGNDSVSFAGPAVNLFGTVKLKLGDGNNALNNAATALSTGSDFVVTSGKGVDDLLMGGSAVIINGKLDMNSGAGADQVGFDVSGLLQIGKTATLKTTGDVIGSTDQTLSGATAVGTGGITMSITNGTANQHVISTGGPVVISGAATFTSGKTGNFGEVKVNATSYLTVSDKFSATTGGHDSELEVRAKDVNGRIGGSFTSTGFASVIAEFSGSIVGAVKLTLPSLVDGYVFLGTKVSQTAPLWLGAVTIASKGQGNTIALSNAVVQGALKVNTGANNDDFVIDDTILLGASTIDLGAGGDRFLIETGTTPPGSTQIFGKMLLKGGAGSDTFTFGGSNMNIAVRAIAQVTVDGGADVDTLQMNANLAFALPIKQLSIP